MWTGQKLITWSCCTCLSWCPLFYHSLLLNLFLSLSLNIQRQRGLSKMDLSYFLQLLFMSQINLWHKLYQNKKFNLVTEMNGFAHLDLDHSEFVEVDPTGRYGRVNFFFFILYIFNCLLLLIKFWSLMFVDLFWCSMMRFLAKGLPKQCMI